MYVLDVCISKESLPYFNIVDQFLLLILKSTARTFHSALSEGISSL